MNSVSNSRQDQVDDTIRPAAAKRLAIRTDPIRRSAANLSQRGIRDVLEIHVNRKSIPCTAAMATCKASRGSDAGIALPTIRALAKSLTSAPDASR